jgi:hypothetical protein
VMALQIVWWGNNVYFVITNNDFIFLPICIWTKCFISS